MDLKPIPAFYCCYLLRSTVRHSSLYVGSTPNPQRRLAQHNGLSKGGAARTARNNLRPWEMACIVTGFPSNISALQFEWAWQNTHLTRWIAEEDRITIRETINKKSKRTGRTRRQHVRPRMSLVDKIANLHLLLRVSSFARWPLEVRFFCEDVYQAWNTWNEKADPSGQSIPNVVLDLKKGSGPVVNEGRFLNTQAKGQLKKDALGKGGIQGIEVSYAPLKGHVQKSVALFAERENPQCCVCAERIQIPTAMMLVCTKPGCQATSHLTCLSKNFLEHGDSDEVVPVRGICPSCKGELRWVDMVKEMTLRLRGDKDVAKLMKEPRKLQTKALTGKKAKLSDEDAAKYDDDENMGDIDEEEDEELRGYFIVDEPRLDEAITDLDDENDDMISVISSSSDLSQFSLDHQAKPIFRMPPNLDMVIEDTDWDSADCGGLSS